MANEHPRKHYLRTIRRIFKLYFSSTQQDNAPLATESYDRISSSYDESWTNHMRDLTSTLIDQLNPQPGELCLDLTCGTGYATNLLAEKTGADVIGVDASEGMLAKARMNCGDNCRFFQSDILEYVKKLETSLVDNITCCWGLGYSRPYDVLREIKRVLKPGGKVAIIDNTMFSLYEIMYCSFLTFAEQPDKLENLMKFRFLPHSMMLRLYFMIMGMNTLYKADGIKSYMVKTGKEAVERLRATGAAAGFEYACEPEDEPIIFSRFAEIIEDKYLQNGQIRINHRYLAGIAQK